MSCTPALGWAIWAVIWIHGIFSFWQEFQAELALSTLKKVLPMQVKVHRDSAFQQVPARNMVRIVISDDMGHLSDARLRPILKDRIALVVARRSLTCIFLTHSFASPAEWLNGR